MSDIMSDFEIELENLNDEIDTLNPMELLSSNDVINAVQMYDSTV